MLTWSQRGRWWELRGEQNMTEGFCVYKRGAEGAIIVVQAKFEMEKRKRC